MASTQTNSICVLERQPFVTISRCLCPRNHPDHLFFFAIVIEWWHANNGGEHGVLGIKLHGSKKAHVKETNFETSRYIDEQEIKQVKKYRIEEL